MRNLQLIGSVIHSGEDIEVLSEFPSRRGPIPIWEHRTILLRRPFPFWSTGTDWHALPAALMGGSWSL